MDDVPHETKRLERLPKRLQNEAQAAFEAGDYRKVSEINRNILEVSQDSEERSEALLELSRLRVDPWAVRAGIAAAAIFVLSWVLSL